MKLNELKRTLLEIVEEAKAAGELSIEEEGQITLEIKNTSEGSTIKNTN
mgnify:CR=1 FL=1